MRYFQKNSSNHILDVVKFLAVLAYGPNVNDEDTPIIGNAASKEEDMYQIGKVFVVSDKQSLYS